DILIDCDADVILLKVEQVGGAACHTGHRSCFFRQVTVEGVREVGTMVFDPATVYGKADQPGTS
ncbi:MAG TPA: phosphoribosyl-AMP cyclohydrolase, partial [Pirellulales bacterium]|nr:phosphoribosyl-AMP cyclohydrolase [Pirellulales bacterium]